MIFCLCYFSCYNMVAKFYYQDYVSYAHVLSTLISALNALHCWSRLCWCMSPQKLLFCYHLPTWGRAGIKLGDAWYVSNVSIIFDAPCLFIHHLLSGTNLLTRRHSVSSLFSAVFVFQKSYTGNILRIGRSPKQRRRGTRGQAHHRVVRPSPWPCHWYVSNVSIIFDAPCLFLHHLLNVSLHFVAFLCIFRN
jgi:hypothetical protein